MSNKNTTPDIQQTTPEPEIAEALGMLEKASDALDEVLDQQIRIQEALAKRLEELHARIAKQGNARLDELQHDLATIIAAAKGYDKDYEIWHPKEDGDASTVIMRVIDDIKTGERYQHIRIQAYTCPQ